MSLKNKKRILIADDEAALLRTMTFILKRKGYETVAVDNGRSAYNKILETYKNKNPFDLVITDIQMPGLSGIELTKKLSEDGITVPILAITGYGNMAMVVKLMRAGCKDYLDKPFSMQELMGRITEILDNN